MGERLVPALLKQIGENGTGPAAILMQAMRHSLIIEIGGNNIQDFSENCISIAPIPSLAELLGKRKTRIDLIGTMWSGNLLIAQFAISKNKDDFRSVVILIPTTTSLDQGGYCFYKQ